LSPRTRRLLLACLPAAAVALAVGAWLLWPRTAITRENAAKIHKGMTRAEVKAILGGPPRDESSGPVDLDEPDDGIPDLIRDARLRQWIDGALRAHFDPEGGERAAWQSNQVAVYIWWDAAGTVESCDCFPMRRAPEGPLEVLRRWLGL
jgi:hypothetical protein